ncbi:DUF6969 family protein [Chelativorans alearense]|uniref:DUF6969 family protein n=1 Tax=Chelativorans alearense TaxID=2681495 RepID=UPI00196A1BBD|nr:hypothetical protein [Chelativorans alearense]
MTGNPAAAARQKQPAFDFSRLDEARLKAMLAAGEDIAECYRVLKKTGLNIVGEILKGQGQFYELNHYPSGDVYDRDTHSQYYYHAHREGEHGHFHTFLRQGGMPADVQPVPEAAGRDWPSGKDAQSHIVAVSMDRYGYPLGLFTTNRWVTGETWYSAADVCRMLGRFAVDHAYPSWPANRWLTAMLRLFGPQIEVLLHERDARLKAWAAEHPDRDPFEDRELEVLSETHIDVDAQMEAVQAELARR